MQSSPEQKKAFAKEVAMDLYQGKDRSLKEISKIAETGILAKDALQELDRILPNEFIFDVHKYQLGARILKKMKFEYFYSNQEIVTIVNASGGSVINIKPVPRTLNKIVFTTFPDRETLDKSLDKIYKLKGLYAPEKVAMGIGKMEGVSDEELDKAIAEEKKSPEMERFEKFTGKEIIEG